MTEKQDDDNDNLFQVEQEILERDSLLSPEARQELDERMVNTILPLHTLLIKKRIQLKPNEIPPAVIRLYSILRNLFWRVYDVERGLSKIETFSIFEGLGLEMTLEQKKEFLTQLLQDEEVKAAIFPETN